MSPRSKGPKPRMVDQVTRYRCPECEQILDEGENRCDSCHKFGSRVDGFVCPHCGEFIEEEEIIG